MTHEIFNTLVKNLKEIMPELEGEDIQREDSMVDLGANSVDRADVITMTMEDLLLDIPRVALFGANNLGELADLMHQKREGKS